MRAGELDLRSARRIEHSRESSLELLQSGATHVSSHSPSPSRLGTPRSAAASLFERTIDLKAAASYGHHRQTSIVHGIQHSRNGSHASTSSNPLSPEIIAAAGAGLTPERVEMHAYSRGEGDSAPNSRPPTSMSGTTLGQMQLPERTSSTTEASTNSRKLERMQSGRRRDHSRHHSNSRHYKEDQKTVGEYALHVLFTSVGGPALA